MVSGIDGDGRSGVVGFHEGEVVAAHVGKTLGVLIDERGLGNGVRAREVARQEEVGSIGGARAHSGGLCGVVRPVGLDGGVLDGEEENLDGVGEADVVAGSVGGVVGLRGGGLYLFNEDITRGASHSLTFVIGDNGVVGPDLYVGKVSAAGVADVGAGGGASGKVEGGASADGGLDIPSSQKIIKTAECEAATHVIVREGGGGEGDTAVSAEEEGKGEVEHLGGKDKSGVNEVAGSTNHVGITNLFATGHGEGSPEIEEEAVETSSHQIVESDTSLTDKIVGKIGGP